jgi:hypothetical protein
MKPSNDHPGSVGDNSSFVALILAAREDADMNATLEAILALPHAQRKSLISSLTADMKKKEAPPDFIAAIAYLQDDEVARQVREALKG